MSREPANARRLFAALVRGFVLGWLIAMTHPTAGAQDAQPPRTLDKGVQSNIDSARQAVARTPAEWSALWKAHDVDRPPPAVDFAREMVVGVFMGSRPTAGFNVEIVGTEAREHALVVRYRETAPGPGAVAAQILTSPFHIVALPKASPATKVTFEAIGR